MEEKEDLVTELKHQKEATSISRADVETLYTDWGMVMDDNQKLAQERHFLFLNGLGYSSLPSLNPRSLRAALRGYIGHTWTRGIKRV
ncbi:hypothetical protein HanIR_Chr12g0601961 [Helianthus annuus]|nr:hypothetical protein HanIR_Chr12g0601961 [Helianthus annuus]